MKKRREPSADIVGLSSGKRELIFLPIFSTFTIVCSLITSSFCSTNFPVSAEGCAESQVNGIKSSIMKSGFFIGNGFDAIIRRKSGFCNEIIRRIITKLYDAWLYHCIIVV